MHVKIIKYAVIAGDVAVPGTQMPPQMKTNVKGIFHSLFFKSLFGIIRQFRKMYFAVSTGGYFVFLNDVSYFMFSIAFITGKVYNPRV